jgi:hypothetical protein
LETLFADFSHKKFGRLIARQEAHTPVAAQQSDDPPFGISNLVLLALNLRKNFPVSTLKTNDEAATFR